MSIEAARAARELQMLEAMVDCAHELGLAFGAAVKTETEVAASLARLEAFQKCFLAVRLGIRLCMNLRADRLTTRPYAADRERPEALEQDPPETEPLETERRERGDPPERERDREGEPVSLPAFLRTLGVVAREAAQLEEHLPAHARQVLPALQGLLAQAHDAPAASAARPPPAGVAILAQPGRESRVRDRLLGTAAVSGTGPPGRRSWSGSG